MPPGAIRTPAGPRRRTRSWRAPRRPGRRTRRRRRGAVRARRRAGAGSPGGRGGDVELEDIRPVVVAGGVETLPLLVEPCRVELGVEDALLVVERPGQVSPIRIEDGAAAAADHLAPGELLEEREVGGVGARPLEVARRDDERPRLARDVDERGLPGV